MEICTAFNCMFFFVSFTLLPVAALKKLNLELFVRVVIGDGVYLPVNSCKACEEDRTASFASF